MGLKTFIITGTSRGLGEALAARLASPEHQLFCISRTKSGSLLSESPHIHTIEFDLAHVTEIDRFMTQIFNKIDYGSSTGLYLINNAAVITPLGGIEHSSSDELIANVQVNLLAPILLTSAFIRLSQPFQIDKRVINISSGSAEYLLPGLSVYSSAKAGLDVFTKCVALEQGDAPNAVRVVSVWPGMIDTSLQQEARSADRNKFASAEVFNRVKARSLLQSADATAEKIVDLLLGNETVQGAIVKDLFA